MKHVRLNRTTQALTKDLIDKMRGSSGWKNLFEMFKTQVLMVLSLIVVLWSITITDQVVLDGKLQAYGIQPRTFDGFLHIPLAPYLHKNISPHLLANTFPLLFLGWLVSLHRLRDFIAVTFWGGILGGLGVWVIGRDATHLGSSILIFAYLGFLLLRGYFERSIPAIVISIGVAIFYGTDLLGMVPTLSGVSWEGHLSGFVAGILCAYIRAKEIPLPKIPVTD